MQETILRIKNFWEKWKSAAEAVGNFQFNLLFSMLYYLLVVPFGLVVNFFGDFLDVRKFPNWKKVEGEFTSIKKLKQQ